jgi:hypothetical protein
MTMKPVPLNYNNLVLKSWIGLLVAVMAWAWPARAAVERPLPKPLANHPGNIFLAGEEVNVPVPGDQARPWQLLGYRDATTTPVEVRDDRAALGKLPVGFYRLRSAGNPPGGWVSLGVVEPLAMPTPQDSPIALDVAMAWFYKPEQMDAAASLCALAGINWVRDRMTWAELEPKRGSFAAATRYDQSARAQAAAGLRLLQVQHRSPGWANPEGQRFPLDLRDAYHFHRELAKRWQGQVPAFEPWNEADIEVFGGHTGSEMASLQKAAYLGLKAGNPKVIACLNVFAAHRQAQLADLHANAAWPYFDTYNLHHYEPYDRYPLVYADHRAVSAGRPLWVTECAMPVKWSGDAGQKELPDENLWEQSERLVKTFAASLHENPAATFYFMLPHYVEGQTQFGILRPDLTPRPAYVSLAAVGRLLAGAHAVGCLTNAATNAVGYLFKAKPDGRERDVLVAWAKSGEAMLPLEASGVWDHLGRPLKLAAGGIKLTPAPVLVALKQRRGLQFTPSPKAPEYLSGKPSPVVFQVLISSTNTVLAKSAAKISTERPETLPVYAYNFSDRPVRGTLTLAGEPRFLAQRAVTGLPRRIELAPMERKEIPLALDLRAVAMRPVETLSISGDFGAAGQPVLSFNLMPDPPRLDGVALLALNSAADPARWAREISGDGDLRVTAVAGGVAISAEPKAADRWVYPRLDFIAGERAPAGANALAFQLAVGEGGGQFRVIWREAGGACYVSEIVGAPKAGKTIEAVAPFDGAVFGTGWSPPDANSKLDPDRIEAVKIGLNSASPKVQYTVRNVRWIQY